MNALLITTFIFAFILLLIGIVYKISVGSTDKIARAYIQDWVKLNILNLEHKQARVYVRKLEKEFIPTKTEIKASSSLTKLVAPRKIEMELYVPKAEQNRAEELIRKWQAEEK